MIADCLSCLNSTFCTACINDTYFLVAISGSQLCLPCSSVMQNCQTCSNYSECTSCIDDSFYIATDQSCQPCSNHDSQCLTCSFDTNISSFSCLTCSVSYFVNASNLCQSCVEVIPNCSNCTNHTFCTDCVNLSYAFDYNSTSCVLCSSLFLNCLECTSTKCTACPSNLELVDGGLYCDCLVGTLAAGLCTSIIGCTAPAELPDGTQTCLACDVNRFESEPVKGVCVCLDGKKLVNEMCTGLEGCLTPIEGPGGSQICAFCNISAGFLSTSDSDGSCVCPTRYIAEEAVCLDICGDGYLMNNSAKACDDGNLDSGDGCSAACSVEVGFRCENGSNSGPSSCVYTGIPLSVTLKQIERT